jgi:hypothetical protein
MSFREGAADSDPILTALHFQLSDPGIRNQLDQLTNLLDCHNGIA